VSSPRDSKSWAALVMFYVVMLAVAAILDWSNGLLTPQYALAQVGLITLGVAIFALFGWRLPNMTAEAGALLAFSVGILTIVPAILMGLGEVTGFWANYFLVAFGMAGGSFLALMFVRLATRLRSRHN
jgi:hypothetical protein